MNKFFLITLLFLSACLSNPSDELQATLEKDKVSIAEYAAKNNLKGTTTVWGGYHVIDQAGNSKTVQETSINDIGVSLYLLNGIRFFKDSSYIFQANIGSFMPGITLATALMREGEKARFLIPSLYAFGNQAGQLNGVGIPANSIVLAEITHNAIRDIDSQKKYEETIIRNYIDAKKWTAQESSGVYYVRQQEGTGEVSKSGEIVRVAYTGKRLDGSTFDSSLGFTVSIDGGTVIEGWNIALKMLKQGEKGTFFIPSHLAYGARGANGGIAPFETLIFEIERLKQ